MSARPSIALALGVTLMLSLAACEKKDPAAGTVDSAAPATAAASDASAASAVTASAVPTEQDFEDDAERTITPQNIEAEIAKLEAELK